MVISIFAKKYDPKVSAVKLSAVQLSVELFFPSENALFSKNMELYGVFVCYVIVMYNCLNYNFFQIVDVDTSCVSMLPTKVEIKLKKAEAVSWGRLEYPKPALLNSVDHDKNSETNGQQQNGDNKVESVDLGDL